MVTFDITDELFKKFHDAMPPHPNTFSLVIWDYIGKCAREAGGWTERDNGPIVCFNTEQELTMFLLRYA